jgi:hypothetical protein
MDIVMRDLKKKMYKMLSGNSKKKLRSRMRGSLKNDLKDFGLG